MTDLVALYSFLPGDQVLNLPSTSRQLLHQYHPWDTFIFGCKSQKFTSHKRVLQSAPDDWIYLAAQLSKMSNDDMRSGNAAITKNLVIMKLVVTLDLGDKFGHWESWNQKTSMVLLFAKVVCLRASPTQNKSSEIFYWISILKFSSLLASRHCDQNFP